MGSGIDGRKGPETGEVRRLHLGWPPTTGVNK